MSRLLTGRRVVNTRALHQADELSIALRSAGAIPISYPCIAIKLPDDRSELRQSLRDLADGSYDWLLLTSVNAVQALVSIGIDVPENQRFSVAAVGPATRTAAERLLGVNVHIVPEVQTGADLARAIPNVEGKRFLLPVSDIARPETAELLSKRGGKVTTVAAYSTVSGCGGDDLPAMFRRAETIDAIVFTSPSTVDGFITRLKKEEGWSDSIVDLPAVCMGSSSAETARARRFRHVSASVEPTVPSLISTLAAMRPSW